MLNFEQFAGNKFCEKIRTNIELKGAAITVCLIIEIHEMKDEKSKAKMCNGRRHVPLCPACANEK